MSRLKLFFLGSPRIELDEAALELELRKGVALLAYLAVAGQSHSRDGLSTLLWPDSDQYRARSYLRHALWLLKKALGDSWLEISREQVGLQAEVDIWLDVQAFQQGTAAASGTEGEGLPRLAEAVELYRGDFLSGFTLPDAPMFDEWQFFQTEELRAKLAGALERLVWGYSHQSNFEVALPHARRWVALDPLHELAQRQLIQVYDRAGQPAAALRQYEEYVKLLEEELGLPPEEETTTLYEAIKAKRIFAPFIKAEEQRSKKAGERKEAEAQKLPGGPTEAPATGTTAASGIVPTLSGEELASSPSSIAGPPLMAQQIRYCRTPDGVRLAYATVGHGPPLVKAANWLSHVEYDWQSPIWRHWLAGLAEHHTLIRYDERGCGLSDWEVDDFSVDIWVQDLEAVVDTLRLEQFPLLGISQGSAVAIAYAVRHPEKISHLILYGGFARGWRKRDLAPKHLEAAEALIPLIKSGWGRNNPAFRQVFTSLFIPGATAEQMHWFNNLQRKSTSVENAARFVNSFYDIDVSDLAPQLSVPTLVLHSHHDALASFEEGRRLAAMIPGAHFVPLDSNNHILLEHEPAWWQFLDEVHQFLGVEPEGQPVLPASPKR